MTHSGLRTGVLADVLTLDSREEDGDRLRRDMKLPDPLRSQERRGNKMKLDQRGGEKRGGEGRR